jgi:Rad3-related DNA helicase/serine/threonine protein kinase
MAEVELRQIGTYSITELLSVRSTCTYYKGHGKQRNKTFSIKRLNRPFTSIEEKEAFLLRGKQLKKLANRNIERISEVGFDNDHGYLVAEYITGETLHQRIETGTQQAPDKVKQLLSPIAAALHYAHVNNTLHGNIQPTHIFSGPNNDLIVAEFALNPAILTTEETLLAYCAPEHLRGAPEAASDQYSLAVMVYEWLCGRLPYEANERESLLAQQEQATIPLPSSLNPHVSKAVEQVVMRALSYKAEDRFAHVMQFSDNYLSALMGFSVKSDDEPRLTVAPALPPGKRRKKIIPLRIEEAENTAENIAERVATPTIPAKSKQATQEETEPESMKEGEEAKTIIPFPIERLRSKPAILPATLIPETEPPTRTIAERSELFSTEHKPNGAIPKKLPTIAGANGLHLQALIAEDLCQGGILSRQLPGYEERPAQVEMAAVVAQAITQRVPAIIEASTGTGKTISYLIPVVRSEKIAIVSTANKALQEQLFYKDIPFIQKHIKPFGAALVKGFNNYICLDRLETEKNGFQYHTKNREFQRLYDLVNDPESTFEGDIETLGFQLPGDVRGRVNADSEQCAWSKCGFYGDCYVRQMRERATMAQVIVVNHTLLLIDAAMGGFLLPERDVIILDEAHHLEEEATRSFTTTVSPQQITSLLAQRMLKDNSQLILQDEALKAASLAWSRLEQVADPGFKGRCNLQAPLEEGLRLATVLSDLADSLRKQRPKNLGDKEDQIYDKLLKRTQNLSENVRIVFSVANTTKFVYYVDRVEGPRQGNALQASAAPLDVTKWLQERLFDKCNVICTSATLATIGTANPLKPEEKGPNFSYFRKRVGLDPLERPEVIERILPLTFDYESNALLYIPRDLPAPTFGTGSDDYMLSVAREMYRLVKLSRGRAFLLFSSKRMLDRAYDLMSPHLPYPLLKQGDMTRIELTKRFREEEGAVLFGLKSFWEGVDIAGEALSLVVIDKLPFDPPDDPVHEARVAQMKAAGENWFGTYVLPQAVLRLKQGIGRLLRTREDRGVMAILDTRLHSKGYGKMVLNALPPARRSSNIRDVERFFSEEL